MPEPCPSSVGSDSSPEADCVPRKAATEEHGPCPADAKATELDLSASKEELVSSLLQRLTVACREVIEENQALRGKRKAQPFPKQSPQTFFQTCAVEGDSDCTVVEPARKCIEDERLESPVIGCFSSTSNRQISQHNMSTAWILNTDSRPAPRLSQFAVEAFATTNALYAEQSEFRPGFIDRFVIPPGSLGTLVWDGIGLVLIVYDLLVIPLRPFNLPEILLLHIIEWISLVYWTLNVVMSLLVGYIHKGVTIMKPHKIFIHYLKTWFLLDFIILFPDWLLALQSRNTDMGSEEGSQSMIALLRVVRLTKVMRLLRLAKIRKAMRQLTDHIDSEFWGITMSILKMFLLLLTINHMCGSLWYAIGTAGDNSWVRANHYDEADFWTRYAVSFQWALTQFTPASKVPVHPVNLKERGYAIFMVLFALIGFAYILGSISSSIAQLRVMAEEGDKQFFEARRFLRQHEVSSVLRVRILRFLEHAYAKSRTTKGLSSIKIFGLLSDSLRSELQTDISLPLLKVHPLFARFSVDFKSTLMRLASCLKSRCFAHEEVLFFEAEQATHMYFLEQGSLHYVNQDGAAEVVERKEAWITEPVLWTDAWFHTGRATALMEGSVFLVAPQDFVAMVSRSPAAFEMVAIYARRFMLWLNSNRGLCRSDVYRCDVAYAILERFLRREAFHAKSVSHESSGRNSIFAWVSGKTTS